MPNRRLVAIVTGLMLVFGGVLPGTAAPTLEQLQTIDGLLSRKDTRGLWAYLQQNPQLLTGDDELAMELRKFCTDVTLGRLSCHYVPSASASELPGVTIVSRRALSFLGTY